MMRRVRPLLHWLGVDMIHVSHQERLLATIGALSGISCCWLISSAFVGAQSATLIIASMGAGAVLLFAVPHGALSQPWAATAGHLLPALVGVTCARWIEPPWLAAAVAVGLAVLIMHYARCLHPPGGATALIAVVGGPDIHALGYGYVVEPVLLNALTLLTVALLFNNLSGSRRYPAAWARGREVHPAGDGIRAEDLRAALAEMDIVEDISEEDLLNIIERATLHAARSRSG